MASNTFFTKLKETCRRIDTDVNDIKMKMIANHEDHNKEEIASKKICEIQDKMNSMKNDTSELKNMLGVKLAHTRNFIKNFKELMAETEVAVSTKEEYLKQYGYTPAESTPQNPEIIIEESATPDKKLKEDLPVTPTLLEYGISSYNSVKTPELTQKSEFENSPVLPGSESTKPLKCHSNSGSTPTLDVAAIITVSKSERETPPFPEPLYTPAKETPPMPSSLAFNSGNFPSTPKLNI